MSDRDRNWAHNPNFDATALANFEERLARARPTSRAQYLRVKGATLLELQDPAAVPVAISHLRRVVEEHDDFLQVPWAHELLGEAFRRIGDVSAAEHHLRECLRTADDRRNGTTNVTELALAEVLLAQERTGEARELLAHERLARSLVWKSTRFRFAVAWARVESAQGGDAQRWAAAALDVANDPRPDLPRDPSIGRVEADEATLAEMRQLATAPLQRRRQRLRRRP